MLPYQTPESGYSLPLYIYAVNKINIIFTIFTILCLCDLDSIFTIVTLLCLCDLDSLLWSSLDIFIASDCCLTLGLGLLWDLTELAGPSSSSFLAVYNLKTVSNI